MELFTYTEAMFFVYDVNYHAAFRNSRNCTVLEELRKPINQVSHRIVAIYLFGIDIVP